MSTVLLLVCLLVAGSSAPVRAAADDRMASGSKGLVASGRSSATAAGIRILEQGGNAADAAAGTLLALSVTTVGAFCIGGEAPVLVYDVKKRVRRKSPGGMIRS